MDELVARMQTHLMLQITQKKMVYEPPFTNKEIKAWIGWTPGNGTQLVRKGQEFKAGVLSGKKVL